MSDAPVPGVASPPVEPAVGPMAILAGIYAAPGATFAALARRPTWVFPFLLVMVVNTAFTFVWLRKGDPVEISRVQMEEAGVFDRVPADQHDAIVQRQARMLPIFAWLGPIVFAPIVYALMAGLFLFVFRFFYAAETTYRQSLAVLCWSFLAFALVTTSLTALILALRGDWNVDPRNALQANPAGLFEKGAVPKPVHALLDSLDLFSAWLLFLWSTGYAAAAKRSVGSAALGIVGVWAIYVLLKVGLAAIF
jgi:Yip1 domain